ncbi:MAG: hypothetical protein WCC90_09070 [Methylocella sp.]
MSADKLATRSSPKSRARRPTGKRVSLESAKLEDVERWGWDDEKLLKVLVDLDHELIGELTDETAGNAKQWSSIFRNNPQSWRLIIDKPNNILGYWEMHPLFAEYFEMAESGQLIDSQLTVRMIKLLDFPGVFDVYFSMLGIKKIYQDKYRNDGILKILVQSIFEVLDELARNKTFIRKIAAAAWTPQGEVLCKQFGLEKTIHGHVMHNNVKIYSGSISGPLNSYYARGFKNLRNRYRKIGLLDPPRKSGSAESKPFSF